MTDVDVHDPLGELAGRRWAIKFNNTMLYGIGSALYSADLDDSPRMKRFTLASGLYDTADTLVGAIEWLNGLLAEVPAEYRDSVKFDLDPGGYEDSATLEIWYERPMTAEEIAEEDERNRASMERFKAQREADERAQFERLRAKFGKA